LLVEYIADDIKTVPALVMAPVFGYYFHGGAYPCNGANGSQLLPDVLTDVVEAQGGKLRLRTSVSRILIEQNRVAGVELAGGEIVRAGAVISNADVKRTFMELVGPSRLPPHFSRRIEALRPSCSAFMVFLGLDFIPDIEPMTIVLENDGSQISLAVPSKIDPSLAPEGHARMTLSKLISNDDAINWNRKDPDYKERKKTFADRLIATAEKAVPGLRDHVVFREEASPATLARYIRSTDGAAYSLAIDEWRPPVKTPVNGLYLSGVGVRVRPGVEDAVRSGMLAAEAVLSEKDLRS